MPKKLLTVDDSKTIRMIVSRAFKPFDLEIVEAANGVEGLAAAAKDKPDIIILDITMPVMDGYEMLSKLREIPELKGIPVIMLTAEAGKENVMRIAKLGVRDYLVKPFKEDLVVERVGRVIELKLKAAASTKKRAFTDPLKILVVDDKPAIIDQVRGALGTTPWKVEGVAQPKAATDYFAQQNPDAVLVSLSLPDNSAFVLFDALRHGAQARNTPILGISVKTATAEQQKATTQGFNGIIFKPIDSSDVLDKLGKALELDLTSQYFVQRDGVLVVALPADFTANTAQDVEKQFQSKVTEVVDAGADRVAVDLTQVRTADAALLKLCGHTVNVCNGLGLRLVILGTDDLITECVNHANTEGWRFANSWANALIAFEKRAIAA